MLAYTRTVHAATRASCASIEDERGSKCRSYRSIFVRGKGSPRWRRTAGRQKKAHTHIQARAAIQTTDQLRVAKRTNISIRQAESHTIDRGSSPDRGKSNRRKARGVDRRYGKKFHLQLAASPCFIDPTYGREGVVWRSQVVARKFCLTVCRASSVFSSVFDSFVESSLLHFCNLFRNGMVSLRLPFLLTLSYCASLFPRSKPYSWRPFRVHRPGKTLSCHRGSL